MFGVNNQEFLYNLQGNTQARKSRQTTKTVDPKRNAIWNLPDLYDFLCKWLYKVYDNRHHPALDQSPNDAFTSGLAIGGQREHRRVEYDETFKILTLPAPTPETRKIQEGKGIKVSNIWYSSDSFRDPTLHKEMVKVRYDPFNIGIVYVFIKNQWVECISSYYSIFNGRSEKEIQLASEEIKKRKRVSGKIVEVSDRELAQFLQSVEEHEDLLKQQLKAIDNQAVLRAIDGGLPTRSILTQDDDTHGDHPRLTSDMDGAEEPGIGVIETVPVEEDEEDEEEFEIYGDF